MFRSVLLLSFATLSLLASCVDLRLPSKISQCEKNNNCRDGTGGATGGKSGATAGAGGSRSADAGVSDVPMAGRGGSGGAGGSTGGVSGTTGGSTGGGTTGSSGGQTTGGTSGSPDAGTDPKPDVAIDKPFENPDLPLDPKPDSLPDTSKTGPEAGAPEPGPDAPPDLAPDRMPDLPDAASDAPTCIQKLKSAGYSVSSSSDGGIKACSECKTTGGNLLDTPCKAMIDCLVPACNSRTARCWTDCRNGTPNADMVVDDCVAVLVSRACP